MVPDHCKAAYRLSDVVVQRLKVHIVTSKFAAGRRLIQHLAYLTQIALLFLGHCSIGDAKLLWLQKTRLKVATPEPLAYELQHKLIVFSRESCQEMLIGLLGHEPDSEWQSMQTIFEAEEELVGYVAKVLHVGDEGSTSFWVSYGYFPRHIRISLAPATSPQLLVIDG
jgi:hypothetical protein